MYSNSKSNVWFDYTPLEVSSSTMSTSSEKAEMWRLDSQKLKDEENGENSPHKLFIERLKVFTKNKQIRHRLMTAAKVREQGQLACFQREDVVESISEIRRRCFCESIGRKFCAVCRRKLNKDLGYEIPGIIVDIRKAEGYKKTLQDEFLETPEPWLPRQLEQASEAFKTMNIQHKTLATPENSEMSSSSSVDDSCLAIVGPEFQSTLTSSNLISALPRDRSTSASSLVLPPVDLDRGKNENNAPSTRVYQNLPSINDSRTVCPRTSNNIIAQGGEYTQNNTDDSFTPLPQLNKPTSSQINLVTKQEENGYNSSKAGALWIPGLPWYSYPIEPVLLELKYINFSIYNMEAKQQKS